jgi:hypothetical protein
MARPIFALAVSEFAQKSAMAGNERGRIVRNHWPQILRVSAICMTVKLHPSYLEHANFSKDVGKLLACKQCMPRMLLGL